MAFVVSTFPNISETFILNQIAELENRGYQIDIYYTQNLIRSGPVHEVVVKHRLLEKVNPLTWSGFMPKSYIKRFLRVWVELYANRKQAFYLIPFLNPFKYGKKALKLISFFQGLSYLEFAKKQYALVHVHFAFNGKIVREIRAKFNLDFRLVVTFHGFDTLARYKYDRLFQDPEAVFTVNSEYTRKRVIGLGCPSERIIILPVGVDMRLFDGKRDHQGSQETVLLFVGRLVPLKGASIVINVLDKLVQRGFTSVSVWLVGGGEQEQYLRDLATEKHLDDKVCFLGERTHEQVRDLMAKANIFLFPGISDNSNREEAQGLVVQEAQAMKMPVIVSDAGGIPEGLSPGKSGFVVPQGNIDLYVENTSRLIVDQIAQKRMGSLGRQFVQENYDTRVLTDRLEKIYDGEVGI